MSTDEPTNSAPADSSDGLVDLVNTMENVDTSAPDAAQNETTISDNNGGRIELNDPETGEGAIRK